MLHVVENSVNPVPATRERLVAPDFSSGAEQLARGGERLGQGLGDVAEAADKIGEKYDEAAVKQADAEDMQQVVSIRAGVLSSKGFDTQAKIGEARQQLEAIRKARLASLHNPRQREMYANVFDQRNIQLEESFATHSATQIAEANTNAAIARADSYVDLAVDSFGTKAFDDNLGTALGEVAAANAGQDPDTIKRKQAQVQSSVYTRAISQMIADPDQVDHADLALKAHAADILPDDEEKLRRQLNPILRENKVDAAVGWAVGGAPMPESGEPTAPHPSDPAPEPDAAKGEPYYPAKSSAPTKPAISPADPLRGKGRITDNAAAHRARGSGNALDIAAPAGTPIYPPMSGKVVKNWYDSGGKSGHAGGWSVLIEHPNGYVTGYAHMRSASPYKEGQQVDADSVIGSVGQTGDATGNHVHYTVREGRGAPKVDPAAAIWSGKGTVNPNTPSWKEEPLQSFHAEENGLDRTLSRIHERATKENWSPSFYNDVVTRARQVAGVQNELYNQQQEDRYKAATQTVVDLNDKFTSVSQIPNFGLLNPSQQYTLQNIAEANKKALAGDHVPANGPRYLMLMGMARSPEYRQQFLKWDPMSDTDITNAERAQLWGMQLKLTQEGPHGAFAANLDTVNGFTNRYLPPNVYGKDAEGQAKRKQFADRLSAAIERQQAAANRPLEQREMDDIARALTVQVTRPSGDKAFGFQSKGGTVNIPQVWEGIAPDIRQGIADRLAAQGLPHSVRDVVRVWLQSRSR